MQTSQRTQIRAVVIVAIMFYRKYLSCLMLHSCRFYPTCSEYAIEAIKRYGALLGGWRAACRVVRCNPLGSWGADPVTQGGVSLNTERGQTPNTRRGQTPQGCQLGERDLTPTS